MRNEQMKSAAGRRDFFRKAGLGVGGAAIGAAATGAATSGANAAQTAPTGEGYRETAHVKKYYELSKAF